jgi:hypothetical protein
MRRSIAISSAAQRFIEANFGTLSLNEIGRRLNLSSYIVTKHARQLGLLDLSPEKQRQFAEAYLQSESVDDVCRRLGWPKSLVLKTAARLRLSSKTRTYTTRKKTETKPLAQLSSAARRSVYDEIITNCPPGMPKLFLESLRSLCLSNNSYYQRSIRLLLSDTSCISRLCPRWMRHAAACRKLEIEPDLIALCEMIFEEVQTNAGTS